METIIKSINATTIITTISATKIAEALADVDIATKAKIRRKTDRMSRAARQEKAAGLGVKIVTPVTSAASAKFAAAEQVRKDFETARKAAKAAAYAEHQRIQAEREAEEAAIDAAMEKAAKEAKSFGKNTIAIAMAKALAAKAE